MLSKFTLFTRLACRSSKAMYFFFGMAHNKKASRGLGSFVYPFKTALMKRIKFILNRLLENYNYFTSITLPVFVGSTFSTTR